MRGLSAFFAFLALSLAGPAFAADPAFVAARSTTIVVSKKTGAQLTLPAPPGMCFYDYSVGIESQVLTALAASMRADGNLLAAFAPCDAVERAGRMKAMPRNLFGGLIVEGAATNETVEAYVSRMQRLFPPLIQEKVAQMQQLGADLTFDPDMRVSDHGLAVGYSGVIPMPTGGRYAFAGVDATMPVRGVSLMLRYNLTDQATAPLNEVFATMLQSMDEIAALNGGR